MLEVSLFMTGFAATAALIPLMMPAAPRLGLLDHPTIRKTHERPVPAVGGLAMGLVFLACFLALRPDPGTLWLVAAAVVVLVGGVLDDRRDLGFLPKFGFQIVAAWLLVKLGGATLTHLGELVDFDRLVLGAVALPFTVFAIVGVMNAVNFSDGMDGLAGGFALAATFWFGVAAADGGHALEFQVACTLAGLLLAFLLFNARFPHRCKALVFMGDAGSYFLGLVLAWLAIRLAMHERPALAPMTAVWILGIPLADTVIVMVRRALRGRSPFRPDHEHVHHLVLRRLSHGKACTFLSTLSFAIGGIGYAAERAGVPVFAMFYVYGMLWIAYYVASSFVFAARRVTRDVPDAGVTGA